MGNTRIVAAIDQSVSQENKSWVDCTRKDVFLGKNTAVLSKIDSEDSGLIGKPKADEASHMVICATSLLTLMTKVGHCEEEPDVVQLHQQVVIEINHFSSKLAQLNFSEQLIDYAAYCLCAAFDEFVLSTPWGTQSIWVQKSMLSVFYSETLGGYRFYLMVEHMIKDPRKYLNVLELMYVILSLGFEGQYFGKNTVVRDEIKNNLFEMIKKYKGKQVRSLSPFIPDPYPSESNDRQKNIVRRLFRSCGSIFILVLIFYNVLSYRQSRSVLNLMNKVGRVSAVTIYSQLINRSLY